MASLSRSLHSLLLSSLLLPPFRPQAQDERGSGDVKMNTRGEEKEKEEGGGYWTS